MKTLIFLLFVASAFAQTTTLTATALRDPGGNLLTGSVCVGTVASPSCANIAAGAGTLTVPNGTYANGWLTNNFAQIFITPGNVTLNGTAVSLDAYFANQFAVIVGSTSNYLIGIMTTVACNGNAVTLPASPSTSPTAPQQGIRLVNLSTTTACTVSGNGNSVIYQSASVSPASLPAKNTAELVWVVNYDGASHNAWIVTHLGT